MSKDKKFTTTLEIFFKNKISNEWIFLIKNFIETSEFKKGERVFNEGDKVKGIYLINSGKIKVISKFDEENERILRLSHGGHLLGHRALSAATYPISAVALTDSKITFIPIDIFNKMLRNNPDFAVFLVEFFATDLRNSEDRMKSMIHNDVVVRIAIILCMLIDTYGFDEIDPNLLHFTLPRNDIANMAGTSYESVIRTLKKFEEMKLIELVGKKIKILKEKELRKMTMIKSRF